MHGGNECHNIPNLIKEEQKRLCISKQTLEGLRITSQFYNIDWVGLGFSLALEGVRTFCFLVLCVETTTVKIYNGV